MTLLIGVLHNKENSKRVLRRLSQESLGDKKVMLEIFSYPFANKVRKTASCSTKFWGSIAEYVLSENGKIICGDNETLFYRAMERRAEIDQQIRTLREELNFTGRLEALRQQSHLYLSSGLEEAEKSLNQEWARVQEMENELFYERNDVIPFRERDPHFAKVVEEEKPEIIILGCNHIPYLAENCFPDDNYSLIYIPPELLIEPLKKHKY